MPTQASKQCLCARLWQADDFKADQTEKCLAMVNTDFVVLEPNQGDFDLLKSQNMVQRVRIGKMVKGNWCNGTWNVGTAPEGEDIVPLLTACTVSISKFNVHDKKKRSLYVQYDTVLRKVYSSNFYRHFCS